MRCSVPGCKSFVLNKKRQLCGAHYQKLQKYGDATKVVLKQHHGKTVPERLEIYTEKGVGCWKWIGSKDPNGYGRLNVGGKPLLAHRLVYQTYIGHIPPGLVLCHRCDNPTCVNPAHMFVGTQADNIHDMERKGRARKRGSPGSTHGMAQLTEDQVLAIRQSHLPARQIAEMYSVSPTNVYDIRNRKIWTHI